MIRLAQHIEILLLDNDCVIVPNFGGFVAHYSPATYIKEEQLFLPPARTIGFNPQLRLNDGLLVQSYMTTYQISFSEAIRRIEKETDVLIEQLHEEGKIHLDNIGELHCNINGDYEFTPYNNLLSTPSLYALDSFDMPELSVLHLKEENRDISTIGTPTTSKAYVISISRAFLRNAVAAVAAILLFFSFSIPIKNTDIRNRNYAQLLPYELFEMNEPEQIASTSSTTTNIKSTSSKSPSVISASTKSQPVDSITQATEVESIKQNPFHIIIAGGITLKKAQVIANELQSKGFSEVTVLNNDGKVRVSIRSFNDRIEATRELLEIRKDEAFKNAWLLTLPQ